MCLNMISLCYFIVLLLRSRQTAMQALIHREKESDRLGDQTDTSVSSEDRPPSSGGKPAAGPGGQRGRVWARGSRRNRLRGGVPGRASMPCAVRAGGRRPLPVAGRGGAGRLRARGSGLRPLSGVGLAGGSATHLCRSCHSSGRPGILGLGVGLEECNSESWATDLLRGVQGFCGLGGEQPPAAVPSYMAPRGFISPLITWELPLSSAGKVDPYGSTAAATFIVPWRIRCGEVCQPCWDHQLAAWHLGCDFPKLQQVMGNQT